MVKRSSIENLKQQVDIYQVIADYVSLKRSGSSWVGLSPFSQEKTPSFHVYPDKGFYYCFSTSKGGDAIRFLQEKENLTFMEAVEQLAERFNVRLDYDTQQGGNRRQGSVGNRRSLQALQESAMRFFCKSFLSQDPDAVETRRYWIEERAFSMEQASDWDVGFAPVTGDALSRHLRAEGFDDSLFEGSGLFFGQGGAQRVGRDWLCRFRGRLMIPIRDINGKVVGFTGRKLVSTPKNDPAYEAKYVNSPATDLFQKGQLLFGLYHAKKHVSEKSPFIMVEGQLDAIRCWTEGIHQAIAPQGTAVTVEQLRILRRHCPRLICCLDGDAAGGRAALRMLPLALAVGLEVSFLTLTVGKDPDEFLRKEGKAGFDAFCQKAKGAVDFMIDQLYPKDGDMSPESLGRAQLECFEIISHSLSETTQYGMIENMAARILHRQPLREDYVRFKQEKRGRAQRQEMYQEPLPESSDGPVAEGLPSAPGSLEAAVLVLILRFESIRKSPDLMRIDPDSVSSDTLEGVLLTRVLAELSENPDWIPGENSDLIAETEQERGIYFHILADESPLDEPDEQFLDCLKRLENKRDRKEIEKIDLRVSREMYEGDAELMELITRKTQLQRNIDRRKSGR